jgi:hypothetical protein
VARLNERRQGSIRPAVLIMTATRSSARQALRRAPTKTNCVVAGIKAAGLEYKI